MNYVLVNDNKENHMYENLILRYEYDLNKIEEKIVNLR